MARRFHNERVNFEAQNDLPAFDDALGYLNQAKGLAQFIQTCPTPMTLAIQGGWGSGKSTMLNLISNQLAQDKVKVVTIETWKFAHLVDASDIPAAFVAEVYSNLLDKKSSLELKNKAKEMVRAIMPSARKAAGIVGSMLGGAVGSGAADSVFTLFEGIANANRGASEEAFGEAASLRAVFDETLEAALGKDSSRRLVVFVDDLDRLPPERAVQIMEALKLFLETKRCVYVLAIDFEVVQKGVSVIYQDSMTEEKARLFFDKIIQVPFNVPSPGEAIRNLLSEMLKRDPKEPEQDHQDLVSACTWVSMVLLDSNPRAIKRVMNALSLLELISMHASEGKPETLGAYRKYALYWMLAVQIADYRLADALVADLLSAHSQLEKLLREGVGEHEEHAEASSDSENQQELNLWHRRIGGSNVSPFQVGSNLEMETMGLSSDAWEESLKVLKQVARMVRATSLESGAASKPKPDGAESFEDLQARLRDYFGKNEDEVCYRTIDHLERAFEQNPALQLYFQPIVASDRFKLRFTPGAIERLRKIEHNPFGKLTVVDLRYTPRGKVTTHFNHPTLKRGAFFKTKQRKQLDYKELHRELRGLFDKDMQERFDELKSFKGLEAEESEGNIADEIKVIATKNAGIGTDFQLEAIAQAEDAALDAQSNFIIGYLDYLIRFIQNLDPEFSEHLGQEAGALH
ncbi:KAP family P-loop NTPase fold protein [Corynebacterium pelargi]|uniref:KAP family P-loop domain protein n=1 Tax=Corynebacterium pelargi TaxID=1471400 RepID=A0A410W7J4_9CORY|nr:P-loop NTPase fold protein [Corynebacterium pelargi]QAU51920.1 KAP family P-loop domain protein [Corynebacterium pelargi]